MPNPATPLPPGFELREVLSTARGGLVARVRRDGRDLVLRRGTPGDSREAVSELAVLARISHAGLAGLVDFGIDEAGAVWVARPWIEGEPLDAVGGGLAPKERGRILVELCVALQHLHERGFVHGDLKAANVLVRPDGSAVLADYGLASAASAEADSGARGSLLHLAPEVLRGAPPDFRSDLFSLGVLAHGLLAGELPDAREFYARFPAESFLAAAGATPADWPEWAREVLSRLLASQPVQRPGSALEVARALAMRLRLDANVLGSSDGGFELPWSAGREEWLSEFTGELGGEEASEDDVADVEADAATNLRGIVVPDAGDAELLASELALRFALGGSAFMHIAIARELEGAVDAARLDERIAGILHAAAGKQLIVSLSDAGAWSRRAVRALVRGASSAGAGPRSVVCIVPEDSSADLAVAIPWVTPPTPSAAELARVLRPAFEAGAGLETWIEGLLEVAGASATRFRTELERDRASGVVRGESAPYRLRVAQERPRHRDTEPAGEREVVERVLARFGPAARRPLAEWIDDGDDEALAGVLARTRERGAPELALDLARAAKEVRSAANEAPSAALHYELGMCWAALGESSRALAVATELGASGRAPRERGLGKSLEGEVLWRKHEFDAAFRTFEAAAELDPALGGRAVVADASIRFARGQEESLDVLVRDLAAQESDRVSSRDRFNVRNLHAMSLLRRGAVDRARELLERERHEARRAEEAMFEAGAMLNLGTLERRTGDLERALRWFRDAARVYCDVGAIEGLAQARALEGGTMRELGVPEAACAALSEALGVRERAGDVTGAASIRGMLGLALADRGALRGALDELDSAAERLEEHGRGMDALLLRSRASETRARIDDAELCEPLFLADPLTYEGDPRALIAHARARWMRGDARRALTLARAAAGLASEKARTYDREEAELLLACLAAFAPGGSRKPRFAGDPTSPRVRDEREAIELLAADAGSFHAARAEAFAIELEARGRIDLATRLSLAIAARSVDAELARASWSRAERLLERLGVGLTQPQRDALTAHLLAIPDPWPADLHAQRAITDDERTIDMDLAAFLEINRRLASQQEVSSLLGVIVECALEITGGTRGFLILERAGELVFDTAFDSRRGDLEAPEVEVSASIVRSALKSGKAIRLSNASEDPLLANAPSVRDLALRSILCSPFSVEAGLRGVIYVDHDLREGQFGPRAETMLGHLANQAAIAIRQVRQVEEIRALNERLSRQVEEARTDLRKVREHSSEPRFARELVGSSEAMTRVREVLAKAAESDIPVLVLGASGTGKELAARAVHENHKRREGPWVGENCAALPESLIESELFGFRKGSFTGADRDSPGMFERASGGTLFLDEIGELPIDLQAKLLRVLETGEVRRLGESAVRTVDFRLVAATNKDLQAAVSDGSFRADLLYRLDGLRVRMPALARRVEDVPELVEHFLRLANKKHGKEKRVSDSVMRALCARPWPGNVRELSNEVARLFLLSEGDIVDASMIRLPGNEESFLAPTGKPLSLAEVERRAIEDALVRTGGDKQAAADLLEISRAKIYQRLAQWRKTDEEQDRRS